MYACICHAITEQQVRAKAQHNDFTYAHYSTLCKSSCCRCLPRIKELIDEAKQARAYSDTYYGGGID